MFVTHLSLADFRSYELVEVPLEAGVTVFTGANGQGKTNLVEAIDYLATLGSHRVASEAPLIRAGAERAIVRARVQASTDDQRSLLLEIEIIPGRANKAALNRAPLRRARDLLGALRVVLFSPEDLAIVKGDPSERRRFLDELITARWPRMAGVRADYDRVLKQRSTLLKSLSGRGPRAVTEDVAATLEVWDGQLAAAGAELVAARLTTLEELRPRLARAYAEIAPTNNAAGISYKSSSVNTVPDEPVTPGYSTVPDEQGASGYSTVPEEPAGNPPASRRAAAVPSVAELAELLTTRMRERRNEEIARGLCLVGPHRDDFVLTLGDLPTKGYASHGESWSTALALRLASFALLRADGVEPVLVLDDVFAELDESRRERLAELISDAEQVLITAAVAADVPAALSGRRYSVQAGTVTLSTEPAPVIPAKAGVSGAAVSPSGIPGQARDDKDLPLSLPGEARDGVVPRSLPEEAREASRHEGRHASDD